CGKHNFRMPDVKMKNGVSLKELNWLNITSLDSTMFDLYKNHPGLNAIPKNVEGADGKPISNDEMVKKPGSILNALEDGLLAVIAITDYLPPSYSNEKEFETGYIMGYLMFADWKNGVLSCITPLLAENSTQIHLSNSSNIEDSPYSKEVMVMITDLQDQTYGMIDSIARMRTGFTGKVWVNNQDKLYQP